MLIFGAAGVGDLRVATNKDSLNTFAAGLRVATARRARAAELRVATGSGGQLQGMGGNGNVSALRTNTAAHLVGRVGGAAGRGGFGGYGGFSGYGGGRVGDAGGARGDGGGGGGGGGVGKVGRIPKRFNPSYEAGHDIYDSYKGEGGAAAAADTSSSADALPKSGAALRAQTSLQHASTRAMAAARFRVQSAPARAMIQRSGMAEQTRDRSLKKAYVHHANIHDLFIHILSSTFFLYRSLRF